MAADVGQGTEEFEGLEAKALATGASKLYIADVQSELVNDFIWPTLKAGARYEGYLLGTSFARPPIAKALVEIARKEGADAIAHGCTGKGNDQVRFELAVQALAPDLTVIAPWREWDIRSREDAISYAEARQIPLKITRETNYSKDRNLWHLSHEGLDLEDPANEPDYHKILELGVAPEQAPDEPTELTLGFEQGIPVVLNGEKLDGVTLIERLNELGGANGVGLLDLVENRLVGMKSRGVYETPGGTILYHAHDVLESITLDRETAHFKQHVALKYAELVYNGQWYSPLRRALDAFVEQTQQVVTGEVKLKLYKGNIIDAGVTSPYTLYDLEIASFGESEYDHADAAGFIHLFGLPTKIAAKRDAKL
jgi:argininosuccinate synthase